LNDGDAVCLAASEPDFAAESNGDDANCKHFTHRQSHCPYEYFYKANN
jgi:hypothetical protein